MGERMTGGALAVLVAVAPLLALSAAQVDPGGLLAALAVATIGAFAARSVVGCLARSVSSPAGRVGRRARAHRLGLTAEPAPRHPRTSGRRRSRAPSMTAATA